MLDTDNRNPRRTIRDVLEDMAWKQNPGLARRMKKRREHTLPQWQQSSRRIMRWQDRVLLALSGLLLVLLVIRAETVSADDDWGCLFAHGWVPPLAPLTPGTSSHELDQVNGAGPGGSSNVGGRYSTTHAPMLSSARAPDSGSVPGVDP